MELELAADPDSLTDLARLKPLVASRDGRPRTLPVKTVWLDDPQRTLQADGAILTEQRGIRRLERLLPGAETWLPGQPPPVLAEVPDPGALPAPLAPLAAFEGKRTTSLHRFGDSLVTITIDRGVLRAVTDERAVARIHLNGAESAVRDAALLIAGAIPAWVPTHALAAEALALATGQPPQPRRQGAPILPAATQTVPAALAHILGHLLDVILAQALQARDTGSAGTEPIHQMRVAVRRARSALSVFRPALSEGALNPALLGFRTLGRELGPSRDWDVLVEETFPAIQAAMPGLERLDRLAAAAGRRRLAHRMALSAWLSGAGFRTLAIELAWFAAAAFWHPAAPATNVQVEPATDTDTEPTAAPIAGITPGADAPATESLTDAPSPTLAAFGALVLRKRWKKLLAAGRKMDRLDIPGLHAVRLRAKRARYAAEIFLPIHGGKSAHQCIRRLAVLQNRLGILNDGEVASSLLEELGGATGRHGFAVGVVTGYMAARAAVMRPKAIRSFRKLRRLDPYWA